MQLNAASAIAAVFRLAGDRPWHKPSAAEEVRAHADAIQKALERSCRGVCAKTVCVHRQRRSIHPQAWGSAPGIKIEITTSAESASQSRGSARCLPDTTSDIVEARLQRLLNAHSFPGAMPQASH